MLRRSPKKILKSDIFRILESEGVTEIGALYKVSPSKFVLVFGSKTAKEKLAGTEIQCRFGDSEMCLNFQKRDGPFRYGYVCFIQFWRSMSAFKGRHGFNRKIRNGKKQVKIFPREEIQ